MLTEKLYHMIEINDTFFNIKLHITKKFIKNPDLFLNFNDKLLERDFDEKLNENPNKFVSWLTS